MIRLDRRTSLMWSISLALLVPGFPAAERESAGASGGPPGIFWLSLPVSLLPVRDPLRGWESLRSMTGKREVATQVPAPPDSSPSKPVVEVQERRVEVYGSILGGGEPVYCFHDTVGQRWFRLAAGEKDTQAGIRLSESGSVGLLLIEDLDTGRTYSFRPGEWRILPEQQQP